MIDSVTLLFPGQGSQYVGMGAQLPSAIQEDFFKQADSALGFSLSKYMLEGPEEKLKETAITQPAILTHSVALFHSILPILKKKKVIISQVLGHSVGEYAALVAANALSFQDAVRLVHRRGKYMQEATPLGKGAMFAILKVPQDIVKKACLEASQAEEEVMPANFNSPDQIVISGEIHAAKRAVSWLEKNYSRPFRAIELNVSAPFHSSLMKPAALKLNEDLVTTPISSLQIPYIANTDAQKYGLETSADTIRNNLFTQIDHSVLWSQSFNQLNDSSLCLEVGPGKVLMGLARKMNRTITCLPLDKEGAISQLEEILS